MEREGHPRPRLLQALPDELALLCLVRVPVKQHGRLRAVCSSWRTMVDSREFQKTRKELGLLESWVMLLTCENPEAMSRISADTGDEDEGSDVDDGNWAVAMANAPEPDCVICCHVLNASCGTWFDVAVPEELAHACDGFGGAFVNGKLYVFAGESCNVLNTHWHEAWSYEPGTNTWRAVADMPHGRAKFVCETVGNEILCVGGLWDPPCEAYNPQADTWHKLDGPRGFSIPLGVAIEEVLYTWSWLSQPDIRWADMEVRAYGTEWCNAAWVEAIRKAYIGVARNEHPALLYARQRLFALSQWREEAKDEEAGSGEVALQPWERLQLKVYDKAFKQWTKIATFPLVTGMYNMASAGNKLYLMSSSLAVIEVDLDSLERSLKWRSLSAGDVKRDLSNCIVPASLKCFAFEV